MKRNLLAALAALMLISGTAYAGYAISDKVHNETEDTVDQMDTLIVLPAFNLDADDDGTEDDADTDSNGETVYMNAAAFGLVYADLTAASTLTTADCGKTLLLNSATEFATTLPAPTDQCRFKFVVKSAPAGASYTVVTASSSNVIIGGINELEVDTGDDGPYQSAGDTITFVSAASGTTPTGKVGDWAEIFSDGTSWYLTGQAKEDGGVNVSQAS